MKISTTDTIAVIVDFQEKLVPEIYENKKLIKNAELLIKGLGELNIPMIISEQYPKGLGKTVSEISELIDEKNVFEKITFSCYENEKLKKAIDDSARKNVLICGTESHICVLQTLIDLKDAGYNTILVEDCVGSRKKNDKKYAVKRAEHEGSIVSTYESVLFELTRVAGTPTFKKISAIIK